MLHVESFFDIQTANFTHVSVGKVFSSCAVIDSVLNYDQDAAGGSTKSAGQVIQYITGNQLNNLCLLETYTHAGRITAAHYLKQHIGGQTAIGIGIQYIRIPINQL